MATWCDTLGSIAASGIRLAPHFASKEALLAAYVPILDGLVKEKKPQFTLENTAAFNVSFTTFDGYQYSASPTNLAVAFQHRMKSKPSSGGPPSLEMVSVSLPFSELLPETIKKLIAAALIAPRSRERKFDRVGIVSITTVVLEDMPPGLRAFVDYVAKPWGGTLDSFHIQITGPLDDDRYWSDQCVHTLTKSEDEEEGVMTVHLDWQRTFKTGRNINPSTLEEALESARNAAIVYFESLGEGGRFDD